MSDPKREELKVQRKRTILAAVVPPDHAIERSHALDEIRGLAEAAGTDIVGEIIQAREKPHIATCMGQGKIEELRLLAKSCDAEVIVFDNNLTPAQGRNLEKATECVIVDRSEVILDIFASTARTYEAKLQVELAQLLYFRPRLKRLWTHLERIEGGVGAGRGPGEKQLETDRRLLDKRVAELKRKLKEVQKRRTQTVSNRGGQTTISLVGYTNAGKSTLMNALTGADVLVADQLFATLDTRTRKWSIPHVGEVLLSDTVGFVRNLPHHLVASFKSTLEEARNADLLLHVVDVSTPEAQLQIEAVEQVLDEIGVSCDNMILVLNKSDRCEDRSIIDVFRAQYPTSVSVSAVSGQGLDRLKEMVVKRISVNYVPVEIIAEVGNGRLVAYLSQNAEVEETEYTEEHVIIRCKLARDLIEKLRGDKVQINFVGQSDGGIVGNMNSGNAEDDENREGDLPHSDQVTYAS